MKGGLKEGYDQAAEQLPKLAGQPHEARAKALSRVRERIHNLNHTTFKDKVWSLLRHYQVPLDGIEMHINAAIDARNVLIHVGTHGDGLRSLHKHLVVIRELLKRIFLALLGYEGKYLSFLNGPEWVDFPPHDVQLALEDV